MFLVTFENSYLDLLKKWYSKATVTALFHEQTNKTRKNGITVIPIDDK